jgi:Tfp pilus assembly protein PilX
MKQIANSKVKRFALFAGVMSAAALAWAASPHFIDSKTRAALQSDGDLEVSFKEAGLGDAETNYLLRADASTTCTCVTRSGQCPNAANKVTFEATVAATGTFSPKNGTVSATLVASAPDCPSSAPPTCGGGQVLELSAIKYTGISLQDTTNGVSAAGLPSELSATFFQCP